jgi:hypothetical protein
VLAGHSENVNDVSFDPRDARVATASELPGVGSVEIVRRFDDVGAGVSSATEKAMVRATSRAWRR